MNPETLSSIKSKEFGPFRTTENIGAYYLEDYLEIDFPTKPDLVVLDFRNRLKLLRSELKNIHFLLGGLSAHSSSCFYNPEHHIVFIDKKIFDFWELYLLSSFHENMHAYNNIVNPAYYVSGLEFPDKFKHSLKTGRVDELNFEKIIVQLSVIEGISNLAEIEVASQMPWTIGKEFINPIRNFYLTGTFSPEDALVPDAEFLHGNFQKIKNAVDKLNSLSDVFSPKKILKMVKMEHDALKIITSAVYFTGYYFVSRVMDNLNNSDLTIADKVNLLVFHPPSTFDELNDPCLYLKNVLKQ